MLAIKKLIGVEIGRLKMFWERIAPMIFLYSILSLITVILLSGHCNAQCTQQDSINAFFVGDIKYELVLDRMKWEEAAD